ncbi:MAG: hypothetical protein Q8S01_00040 [Ignavibacteria bacterium]|nr:hypothetical protein [Ignavibacteria bacterium]
MNKKLRCPMGVPGGIIAAVVGLVGMVISFKDANWMSFAFAAALFLIGGPMARVTMMVHSALDQIEELKKK